MRARIRQRPLLYSLLAAALLAGGAASASYATLAWSSVSAEAVAAAIAPILSADSTAGTLHPGVHDLYAARTGAPAWLDAGAREAALAELASAEADALPLDAGLAGLRALADTAATAGALGALDVALTDALLRHGDALGTPRADARQLYGIWWTPAHTAPEPGAPRLAEALGGEDPAAAVAAWADARRPPHPGYRRLRAALARETALADGALDLPRDLAPGDSGVAVVTLHDRLGAEGLRPKTDDPTHFGEPLAEALRTYQTRRGLPASGRLDGATREALNRRHTELIPLLALNLEKWRWLPRDLGDLHVWVNVPRFELALRERAGDDWAEAIRFVTVVGARDWQTPAFSDTLQTVVFNPTWIVPASIQRESYGSVRGFVERAPGPGNAMGRVKFLFPNDHAVYIHDTPTKWAFNVDDRARSHGCVRAGDPEGLARELLKRTNGWTAERVASIFSGSWSATQHVTVERPVPVHLVYFTAEVDPDGRLRVHEDVYDRDKRLAKTLGLELPDLDPTLLAQLVADRIGNEEAVAAEQAAAEADEAAAESIQEGEADAEDPPPARAPQPPAAPRPVPGGALDSVGLAPSARPAGRPVEVGAGPPTGATRPGAEVLSEGAPR